MGIRIQMHEDRLANAAPRNREDVLVKARTDDAIGPSPCV